MVFPLSDRYKIFTCNLLWIEIYENVVVKKINVTVTTIDKKNFVIDKSRILCDVVDS